MDLKMRKIKFNVRGIIINPKSNQASGVFLKTVFACLGVCVLSLFAIVNGGFFSHAFSSVINAFNNTALTAEPLNIEKVTLNKNFAFSYKSAPIPYVIPNAKINNVLSFSFNNPVDSFIFQKISFVVDTGSCQFISLAELKNDDGDVSRGRCKNDRLEFNHIDELIFQNTIKNYVLSVSLTDTIKVGQHLNFSINSPRDLGILINGESAYVDGVYPMKLATIYVVGLRYLLN